MGFQLVRRAIGDICFRTEGADWREIAAKLRLYDDWEFEGYREVTWLAESLVGERTVARAGALLKPPVVGRPGN